MKGKTHLVDGWHYHGNVRCWRALCGYEFTDGRLAPDTHTNICRNCERVSNRLRTEAAA